MQPLPWYDRQYFLPEIIAEDRRRGEAAMLSDGSYRLRAVRYAEDNMDDEDLTDCKEFA